MPVSPAGSTLSLGRLTPAICPEVRDGRMDVVQIRGSRRMRTVSRPEFSYEHKRTSGQSLEVTSMNRAVTNLPGLGQARMTGRQETGGSVVRTRAVPASNTSVRQGWAAHNICSFSPCHPGRTTFLRWSSRPVDPLALTSNLTIESAHLACDPG